MLKVDTPIVTEMATVALAETKTTVQPYTKATAIFGSISL